MAGVKFVLREASAWGMRVRSDGRGEEESTCVWAAGKASGNFKEASQI